MAELADRVRTGIRDAGYKCSLINARFVKPLDTQLLDRLSRTHRLFVTIEENVVSGGFGGQVLEYASEAKLPVYIRNIGIPDDYVEHGNVEILRREVGLDCGRIVEQVLRDYSEIKG